MAAVSNTIINQRLPLYRRGPPPGFDRRKTPPAEKKRFYMVSEVPMELDAKYAPVRVLGQGSYGVVCSCFNHDTNESVAVKKISDALGDPTTALRTLREMQILRQICHRNVISIKDVMVSSSPAGKSDFKHVYLVQDLMEGDLGYILESNPKLSADACKGFLFQILTGLHHLHSASVIHRDLKPENILLNSNLDVKICDFGLARTLHDESQSQSMTEYMTTRWYRAPEILLDPDHYGTKVDIWSVGCIFAEILGGGRILFQGGDTMTQIKIIHRVLGTRSTSDLGFISCERVKMFLTRLPFSPGVSFSRMFAAAEDPMAIDLLSKMLVFNPENRISAIEALRHPYFSGIFVESSTTKVETVRLEVDQDPKAVDEKMVRELIWNEMLLYSSVEEERQS